MLLASGCATHRNPSFSTAPSKELRYVVWAGGKSFMVDSIRFEGDWGELKGGYPGFEAIWIPKQQVESIQVPQLVR